MTTQRLGELIGFIIAGIILATLAMIVIDHVLEAPEVSAYCENMYPCRIVPGKSLFNGSVNQGYADAVAEALRQRIKREDVFYRYEKAYPISGPVTGFLLSFLDPVKLLLTVMFAGIVAAVYRLLRRRGVFS